MPAPAALAPALALAADVLEEVELATETVEPAETALLATATVVLLAKVVLLVLFCAAMDVVFATLLEDSMDEVLATLEVVLATLVVELVITELDNVVEATTTEEVEETVELVVVLGGGV